MVLFFLKLSTVSLQIYRAFRSAFPQTERFKNLEGGQHEVTAGWPIDLYQVFQMFWLQECLKKLKEDQHKCTLGAGVCAGDPISAVFCIYGWQECVPYGYLGDTELKVVLHLHFCWLLRLGRKLWN